MRFADRVIYQPEDGFTNLSNVLWRISRVDEFLTIGQIEKKIVDYLNKYCLLNEDMWTSHGNWIWHSWKRVKAKLEGMGF